MHFIGIVGYPRRYADSSGVNYLVPMHGAHVFMTIAAIVTAPGAAFVSLNFFWSLKWGVKAPINPWNATTLEWSIPSPPPHDNFGGHYPTVYRGPYEFSVPGAKDDFIPQNLTPAQAGQTR